MLANRVAGSVIRKRAGHTGGRYPVRSTCTKKFACFQNVFVLWRLAQFTLEVQNAFGFQAVSNGDSVLPVMQAIEAATTCKRSATKSFVFHREQCV